MAPIHAHYEDVPDHEETYSAPKQNATPLAVPAPSNGSVHATPSGYENYDEMPDLEQAQAIPSATTIPQVQNAQDDGSAPSSSSLPSAPPHPFLVLAQAIVTAGPPPPGFQITMSAGPGNLPVSLGGLFPIMGGDEHGDQEEDTSEDETGDEHDDMPTLETVAPSNTPPPPGTQAYVHENIANTLESIMLEALGPESPPGSIPSPPPASTAQSNGNEGNLPTSATAPPTQNPPNSMPNGFPPPMPLMPFNVVFGPPLALDPDGAPIDDASLTYNSITANSIESFTAELQATGVSEQLIAQLMGVFASIPPDDLPPFPLGFSSPMTRRRPPFDAVAFVDSLEQVDISTIPEEDLKCPHCWLPFGTTDEDDPTFVFAPDADESPEVAARQIALHEMPFCDARSDNNPVRTPCGHLFGRSCLIETMEKVDTLCPTCRKELRPILKVPNATE